MPSQFTNLALSGHDHKGASGVARRMIEEELCMRELKFRSVWENSADGLRLTDQNGIIIDANPAFCQLVGMHSSELIGQPFLIAYDESERDYILEQYRAKFIKREVEIHFETAIRLRSGQAIDVELSNSFIILDARNTLLLSVYRDVTKRKKIERELLKQREEQQIILESVPAIIFYKDTENRLIKFNEALSRITGLSAAAMEGKNISEIFPHYSENYWLDDREVLESGKPKRNIIEPLETPEGLKWMRTDKLPYRDENGKITGIIGFSVDITGMKEAEEALLQERTRLNLLLKQEKLLFEIASQLHSSDSFSEVLYKLLGTIAETLGVEQVNLFPLNQKFKKVLHFSPKVSWNNRARTKDVLLFPFAGIPLLKERILRGECFQFASPLELDESIRNHFINQNVKAMMAFPIKISDQIMGALCFAHSKAHEWDSGLHELCETIAEIISNACEKSFFFHARLETEKKRNEALEMLESTSRLASIGMLAAGIIHEINQALGLIDFSVENMLYWNEQNKGAVPDAFIKKIRKIGESSQRIEQIMQHVRSFWIQPGKIDRETVDLNESVKKALSLLDRQMHAHGIQVTTELASIPLPMRGNSVPLEQVVINLIINAMQALDSVSNRAKKITVITGKKNSQILLEIQDNACGVPEGIGEKLFDPFYSTKKHKEGMGLGLAIAKLFITEYKGTISVKNNGTGGATFSIQFPLAKPEEDNKNGYTSG